ncbi:MAG: YraN family protein [Fodinibius sp.]|nr:YraN family protein [Fodinibius sp.]
MTTCIVFAEVKTRSSNQFGEPEEYVDEEKKKNVYKAAEAWLYERKMDGSPVRFDVISILQPEDEAPDIKHFENAFVRVSNLFKAEAVSARDGTVSLPFLATVNQ